MSLHWYHFEIIFAVLRIVSKSRRCFALLSNIIRQTKIGTHCGEKGFRRVDQLHKNGFNWSNRDAFFLSENFRSFGERVAWTLAAE